MLTIEERVANGMQAILAYDPTALDRIDLDRLDVGSCDNCVIGQLFGYFSNYYKLGGRNELTLGDCGFALTLTDEVQIMIKNAFFQAEKEAVEEIKRLQFAELTTEWKRQITQHRTLTPA